MVFIESEKFLQNALQVLSNMLSDLMDKTVYYIRSAHTVHSQVSKSLVVNGYLESNDTFNYCIRHIFFYLLQKSLNSFYNIYTNLTAYRGRQDEPYCIGFDCYGGCRLVCRRLMVSNINLSPLIIDDESPCSKHGVNQVKETHLNLKYIVHLGKEIQLNCETDSRTY